MNALKDETRRLGPVTELGFLDVEMAKAQLNGDVRLFRKGHGEL
jgi:hypothetical protein